MATAGIVVIGNEVLSGKVTESNAQYLSGELRRLGVDLRSIVIVPDEIPTIAEAVRTASGQFDFVFTTGGIGPTHDDVTMEAIAASAGVGLRRHEEFARVIATGYGDRTNDLLLGMADLPEGATLLWEEGIPIPVIALDNIYIFPGEPGLLRKEFEAVRERFRSAPSVAFLSTRRLLGQRLRICTQASITPGLILYCDARQPKVGPALTSQGSGEISGTG